MQPYFSECIDTMMIKNIKKQIRQSIKRNEYIILIEYSYLNSTIKDINNLLKCYYKTIRLVKNEDDGSREIENYLWAHDLIDCNFKVCGVKTDYCVLSTVEGLSQRFPKSKITVLPDCCNSNVNHYLGLARIQQIPNTSFLLADDRAA